MCRCDIDVRQRHVFDFYLGDGGPDGFWSDPKLFGACLLAFTQHDIVGDVQ